MRSRVVGGGSVLKAKRGQGPMERIKRPKYSRVCAKQAQRSNWKNTKVRGEKTYVSHAEGPDKRRDLTQRGRGVEDSPLGIYVISDSLTRREGTSQPIQRETTNEKMQKQRFMGKGG